MKWQVCGGGDTDDDNEHGIVAEKKDEEKWGKNKQPNNNTFLHWKAPSLILVYGPTFCKIRLPSFSSLFFLFQ